MDVRPAPVRLLARLATVVVLAGPTTLAGPACGAPERLRSEAESALALREISGLGLGTIDGAPVLLAVGDEARAVTLVPLAGGAPDVARARSIPLPLPEAPGGSQLEAVALDGARLWVLSEGPLASLTELALAGDAATIVRSGALVVPAGHALADAWAADANLRGEGLIVDGARVLVAKQSGPPALIAFVWDEAARAWVAGDWWALDAPDASDLARGPDGSIYMIGAAAEAICRLTPLPPAGQGQTIACARRWALPEALGKGKTQWEGLAFLPDGRPVVAVDRKKSETPNLAVLPRLADEPQRAP